LDFGFSLPRKKNVIQAPPLPCAYSFVRTLRIRRVGRLLFVAAEKATLINIYALHKRANTFGTEPRT